MKKFQFLRKKYPRFVYQNFDYNFINNDLKIVFNFFIEPDIKFQPEIIIENIKQSQIKRVGEPIFKNLIFNLGLMEIPSYWKATCSPIIEIQAGHLDKEQVLWWKDLILKGMGQFFYENRIDWQKPSFLKISSNPTDAKNVRYIGGLNKGFLVPVGGGKDSAVTLELLKKARKKIQCFSLNPTESARKIMELAGCQNPIIGRRKIDEKLLELNRQGFLNGHTPFSAYLAFLGVLAAVLSDFKYIALSNERSSNEGNVRYLGKIINHQWSKSFEFEKKFRNYSKKYLAKEIEYFSFLRPLYEIQIAKLFSKYPKYFSTFLSCNEAYKTASGTKKPTKKWCAKCSKCLFVFAILYPFIKEKELVKIFGKNLFEDKTLLPAMQQLIGERGFKPFECVGTKKESLTAFYLSLKKLKLPSLLEYFKEKIMPKYPNLEKESREIMISWDSRNNLPKEFQKILKKELEKRLNL